MIGLGDDFRYTLRQIRRKMSHSHPDRMLP